MFSLNKLSPTITDMIRFDHSHTLVTFHQYTTTQKPKVKKALAETICTALEIHATLEEEIFYPVMRQLEGTDPTMLKAEPEHNEMRRLIAQQFQVSGQNDFALLDHIGGECAGAVTFESATSTRSRCCRRAPCEMQWARARAALRAGNATGRRPPSPRAKRGYDSAIPASGSSWVRAAWGRYSRPMTASWRARSL